MHHVFAYLDPGSGSIIIQAVIAGIIAVPVIFRNKISAFVRSIKGGHAPEPKETVAAAAATDSSSNDTPAS